MLNLLTIFLQLRCYIDDAIASSINLYRQTVTQ